MHRCILFLQGERTPLWSACLVGRLEVVESLLDGGADINQTTTEVRDYGVLYTFYMYC
jgi:ankyrin repeat protein